MINEADLLAETYTDVMDIKRYVDRKNEYGATKQEFVTIYATVPCAVSKAQTGTVSEEESRNLTTYNMNLFARPDVDIQIGDTLIITRFNGQISEYKAGEPMPYESHIEVPISRKVVA